MSYQINVLLFLLIVSTTTATNGCTKSTNKKVLKCFSITFAQLPSLDPDVKKVFIGNSNFQTISPSTFEQYKNNRFEGLELYKDNIKQILPGAFSMLNNLHELILNHNALETIPRNAFNDELKHLSMTFNQIRHIEREAFKLPKLETLDLGPNIISSIDKDAFLGLHQLTVLSLIGNHIQELYPGIFQGLESLRDLDLDYNEIEKISEGALDNLKELRSLQLQSNKLKTVESHYFKSLLNLDHLSLSVNLIKTIGPNAFKLPQLKTLDLTANKISSIDKDAFLGLHSLKTLSLAGCNIKELVPGIFRDLKNLDYLNLSFNKIEKILKGTFDNLKNLQMLILKNDKLKTLESDYFKSLLSLEYLDLSSNLITTIAQDTFKLPKLKGLKLNRNNISHIDKAFVGIALQELHPGIFRSSTLSGPYPARFFSARRG